jgi:hypothetical protein
MPTHRTGREIREDALRCKNLLNKAEEQLREIGVRTPEAQEVLAPAWKLQSDGEFWKSQSDGLAIFAAHDFFNCYRVPLLFEETLMVNRRFYVKPIVPLLEGDGTFYLLAASQNQLRLFRGTHYSISELTTDSLPKNLRDALNIDEYVQTLQFHSYRASVAGAAAGGDVMFHGQGGADMDVRKKDEIRQYFHRVDRGLQDFLHEQRSPLVFAGVEYLFPIFRETCNYSMLIEPAVRGNPDKLNAQQLHALAWTVVEPYFHESQRAALEKYHNGAGSDLATNDVAAIVGAARSGAVETLFVARGQKVWGTIDPQSGSVALHEKEQPADEDLMDYAAAHTLLNGGTVYTLDPTQIPERCVAAAVFRYPFQTVSD